MLAGRRAFAGDCSVEIMSAVLKEDSASLPQTVPPELERIVRQCLQKQPEDRFDSANDLVSALESIPIRGTPISAKSQLQPSLNSSWIALDSFVSSVAKYLHLGLSVAIIVGSLLTLSMLMSSKELYSIAIKF